MADSDFSVYARILADTSNFEKGMKNAQKSATSLSGSFKSLSKIIGKSLSITGIISTEIKALKAYTKSIKECTESYKKQNIGLRALSSAMKNNPLFAGDNTKKLADFANELQRASNYGDEELIPMMTKLIASGRNEAETMKIMTTAIDLASGANISLETAIDQLNATMNGNIGRLGMQNAELKLLTAEELKSGKAVDILAEKYKGMSTAIIDTSKQLSNMRGDFKEAIGQFTLPSSDMWNKFWTGFYDKGIGVINKFNEYLDKTIIGKGIASGIVENLKKINDETNREYYIQDAIHALTDDQLKSLGEYLSSLKKLTKEQEYMKKIAQWEGESRPFLQKLKEEQAQANKTSEDAKKANEEVAKLKEKYLQAIAEQERTWTNTEKVTEKAISDEEKLVYYQNQLVSIMTEAGGKITENNEYFIAQKQIISELVDKIEAQVDATEKLAEWDEKLFKQRNEGLNQNTKEYHKYINRIIALEYEKVLSTAENEEEQQKIREYYANLQIAENKRYEDVKRNQTKETLVKIANYTKKAMETIKGVFSTAINAIKSIFSGLKSIVSTNFDDVLDSILAFEDSVLTFFLETLPKLPSYLSSILQSILTLVNTLFDSIDVKQLTDIISEMVKMLAENVPQIISKIASIAVTIITALSNALIENLPIIANGLKTIREDLIPKLQTMLHTIIITIGEALKSLLPEVVMFIVDFIAMLLKELPSLLKVIIEAIPVLVQSILEAIPKFFEEDFPTIIAEFMKLIPTLIKVAIQIALEIIKELPHIVASIISGLVKAFIEVDWWQLIVDIFTGFVDAIKSFFGIHSPSTLFADFGGNMIKGMWNGLKNMGSWLISNVTSFFQNVWSSITNVFSGAGDWFGNLFGNIGNSLSNWASSAWETTKNIASGVATGASNLVSGAVQGVKNVASNVGSTIGNVASTVGNFITGLKFWASGTNNAPKGLAIVGEAGPELVNFRGGEQVLNAGNTQKALNSGTHENVFNVTFNNLQDTTAFQMMSQLKQYQRNLAFSGVL